MDTAEMKRLAIAYDKNKDGSVEDYCKKHKIGTSGFYYHRKNAADAKAAKPRTGKPQAWRSDNPNDPKLTIAKLEAKNEVLQEMLTEAYKKAA